MAVPGQGWSTNFRAKRPKSENGAWFCLCAASELPPWHFQHRKIDGGYRQNLDFYGALWSLLYWHNESINIWSHYIATIGLLVYIPYTWYYYLFEGAVIESARFIDIAFVLCLNLFGNVLPILLSAFCHQFYCIDKKWHSMCWFLDFLGILTGMLCAGIGFSFFSFYCSPLVLGAIVYGTLIAYILAIQTCWARFKLRSDAPVLLPADRFPEFSGVLSTFGFVATAVPVLLVLALVPEYQTEEQFRSMLFYSVLGPVLMGLGISCFAQGNFPERFAVYWGVAESHFDMLGHSHQWWHLLSASLQFAWVAMCRQHYLVRIQYGCPA